MSRLCVCREYEDMFTEGYKYVESLEEHDKRIRQEAIDEFLVKSLSRKVYGEVAEDDLREIAGELRYSKSSDSVCSNNMSILRVPVMKGSLMVDTHKDIYYKGTRATYEEDKDFIPYGTIIYLKEEGK